MLKHDATTITSLRHSIADTLPQVMQQVDYECFCDINAQCTDPLYRELCLIISEVFLLIPGTIIKINGETMPASLVQEVFKQIRNEHVRLVFDNYQDVTCRVYNKKAYLRTSLYNAVFELESHYVNEAFCY